MKTEEILARWEQDNNPLFPTFSSFTRQDMIRFAEHYHGLMSATNEQEITYIDYNESDLRFTGWEHECIIIDRTENHYLVPENRYYELMKSTIHPGDNVKIINNSVKDAYGEIWHNVDDVLIVKRITADGQGVMFDSDLGTNFMNIKKI